MKGEILNRVGLNKKLISSVVKSLFSSDVELTYDTRDIDDEERFWLISSKGEARWLIPKKSRYGYHALLQWRPYSYKSFMAWKFMLAIYRTGLIHCMPNIIEVGLLGSKYEKWSHVGWEGERLIPVIYIGTKGVSRKAVTTLVSEERGVPCSIVKTALTSNAKFKIHHEYDVLIQLYSQSKELAPKPIFIDRDKGISRQGYISGSTSGTQFTAGHAAYLDRLKSTSERIIIKDQAIKLAGEISNNNELSAELRDWLAEKLCGLDDSTELPSSRVHGDFMPWNIKINGAGEVVALDWEESNKTGLPLTDFFYFHHFQNYLFNRSKKRVKLSEDVIGMYTGKVLKNIEIYSLIMMLMRVSHEKKSIKYFIDKIQSLG